MFLNSKLYFFGMKSLVRVTNTHVKIPSDNTTTVHAINKMGTSHSNNCDQVANEVWDLALYKRYMDLSNTLAGHV